MLERVARTIRRHAMFEPGERVGVAVSGGADSICLLDVLIRLGGCELTVLHVDHGLRGEESRADAAFVRETAAGYGLPYCETRSPPAEGNLEQEARRARQAFFRAFLQHGGRVATGHTRSDQAETVLMRFLRGSGTAGLAGILPVTAEGLIRPLLEVDRAEVLAYLGERGLRWREDSTNAALDFIRNRIRHELLPALARDFNPRIVQALAQVAEWGRDEEAYWAEALAPPGDILRADALAAMPPALARRVLRAAVEGARGDLRGLDFAHVEALVELARSPEGHGRLQVPGLDVTRSFDWLRLARPGPAAERNYRVSLEVPGQVELPGAGVLRATLCDNEQVGGVDWVRLSGPLEVRNWRPGDQYRPIGHSAEEKIKTLFQQTRVPLWERRSWPVVVQGERILWAGGFGPAADYAASGGGPVLGIWWNQERAARRLKD